jgi:hypothetical protein
MTRIGHLSQRTWTPVMVVNESSRVRPENQ